MDNLHNNMSVPTNIHMPPNIMNMGGPTSGTPISALVDPQMQQQQQQQQQQLMHQQMLMQQMLMQQQMQNRNQSISNLVTDINNSLDDEPKSEIRRDNRQKRIRHEKIKQKEQEKIEQTDDEEDDDDTDEIISGSGDSLYRMPNTLKELTLFVFLYYIMSTGFVKKILGGYIKYINPTHDGDVSFIGIIIYGTLLGSLFLLSKQFI
jgi:hypothetical protein